MNHRAVLESLLRFNRPLAELEEAIGGLEWDATTSAVLARSDIRLVVERYMAGLLEADEVARWAALIECREDVEFEPKHEAAVADALFDLANPDLQGDLADIGPDVLALVRG